MWRRRAWNSSSRHPPSGATAPLATLPSGGTASLATPPSSGTASLATPASGATALVTTEPTDGRAAEVTTVRPETAPVSAVGQLLVEERCTRCHTVERIERASKTEEEWRATVERMVGKGAELTTAEQDAVIDFLVASHGR